MALEHPWALLLPLAPPILGLIGPFVRRPVRGGRNRPPAPRDPLRGAGWAPHPQRTGWRRFVYDGDQLDIHRGRGD
ncbi:hypothetical protein AB0346_00180 [Nocardia beijingensis]|uniref:hypothetical protein n=1 Tax=Nocardia beijingensis TaxID=95162 RepID=UPI00344E7C3B